MSKQVKADNYRNSISRYNRALKEGFHLECIMLVYNFLEDRFTDFFVKIDFAKPNNNKVIFNKYRKMDLISLDVPKNRCSLDKLSNKIDIVKTIVRSIDGPNDYDSVHLRATINVLRRTRVNEMLTDSFFEALDSWRNERNKTIHDLMNAKAINDDHLKGLAVTGFALFRTIDKCDARIKDKTKQEITRLKKQLHSS